jgi:hypothetical protein
MSGTSLSPELLPNWFVLGLPIVAVETMTLSARSQSNGREWVGYYYCSVLPPNYPR